MSPDGHPYPVNLDLRGRRCLVVGGGAVGAEKARGLQDAGADVTVVAPEVSAEVDHLDVTVERRPYRSGEAADYRLVVSAVDDPAVTARISADAEAAGVWVNAADVPEHCTFTLPARVRRGDLLVAVSTGGRSPAFSGWLRRRLEAEIGPEYGRLLELVAEARAELLASGRSSQAVDWRSALDSEMLELVRTGRITEARERLQACLSSSSD